MIGAPVTSPRAAVSVPAYSGGSALQQRLHALDSLLNVFADLWKPQPYKDCFPAWCETLPALAAEVSALTDKEVADLAGKDSALIELVARHLPDVAVLQALTHFEAAAITSRQPMSPHFDWEVPGRKRAQIGAFAQAVGAARGPVLEWCAGKGHLGRLFALADKCDVFSLELDPRLCEQGRRLAQRARAAHQRFVAADVRTDDSAGLVAGRHALALHACGDLHLGLMRAAAGHGALALNIAPCCYHKTESDLLVSLSGEGSLVLSRDDLRLAASNVVTASPRERALRRREAMSKFGHTNLLRAERLSLVRFAFRRALEAWLVLDRARFLEQRGFVVEVSVFCPPTLTPRNLLISARR